MTDVDAKAYDPAELVTALRFMKRYLDLGLDRGNGSAVFRADSVRYGPLAIRFVANARLSRTREHLDTRALLTQEGELAQRARAGGVPCPPTHVVVIGPHSLGLLLSAYVETDETQAPGHEVGALVRSNHDGTS